MKNLLTDFLAWLLFALLLGFVWFGIGHAEEKPQCWECLVANWPADAKQPHRASDGDIVGCQPCGLPWGKKQGEPLFRKIVIEATKAEIEALTLPLKDSKGKVLKKRRHYVEKLEEGILIGDHNTGQAVTPADALRVQKEEAAEVETLSLPAEVK